MAEQTAEERAHGEWPDAMRFGEWACIALKVPESGTPWVDAMILEARRAEFAVAALQGLLAPHDAVDLLQFYPLDTKRTEPLVRLVRLAAQCADAMLAEWQNRQKGKEDGCKRDS